MEIRHIFFANSLIEMIQDGAKIKYLTGSNSETIRTANLRSLDGSKNAEDAVVTLSDDLVTFQIPFMELVKKHSLGELGKA